jgi:hypothetical protein
LPKFRDPRKRSFATTQRDKCAGRIERASAELSTRHVEMKTPRRNAFRQVCGSPGNPLALAAFDR